ncbi:hypothetical protein EJB05_07440, partial [Eragrostis curvula]
MTASAATYSKHNTPIAYPAYCPPTYLPVGGDAIASPKPFSINGQPWRGSPTSNPEPLTLIVPTGRTDGGTCGSEPSVLRSSPEVLHLHDYRVISGRVQSGAISRLSSHERSQREAAAGSRRSGRADKEDGDFDTMRRTIVRKVKENPDRQMRGLASGRWAPGPLHMYRTPRVRGLLAMSRALDITSIHPEFFTWVDGKEMHFVGIFDGHGGTHVLAASCSLLLTRGSSPPWLQGQKLEILRVQSLEPSPVSAPMSDLSARRPLTAAEVAGQIKDDSVFDTFGAPSFARSRKTHQASGITDEALSKTIISEVKQSLLLQEDGSEKLKLKDLYGAVFQDIGQVPI